MSEKSLWSNKELREEVKTSLKRIAENGDVSWILLLATSRLIGVSNWGSTKPVTVTDDGLHGTTHECYGQEIAKFLIKMEDPRVLKGLLFTILMSDERLEREVADALFKKFIKGIPLKEQKLFKLFVDY